MRSSIRKRLVLMASGAILLQLVGGCPWNPGSAAIQNALSTGSQTLINGIIGLYVRAGVNQFVGI